ncbi:MAG: rod shape-determining protein RodA [Lachnospiraceae bacterium]|nr:rod shape-determining protein RodA [Lachnospiraceae bacterium]
MKSILSTLKEYNFNRLNLRLVLYLSILTIIGILAVGSAGGEYYQKRQMAGFALGFLAMVVLMLISYNFILKFYWILYILSVGLLLWVRINGRMGLGAQRWVDMLGIRFQPSEICKVLLILFMAACIRKHKDEINNFKFLIPLGLSLSVPVVLILMQPDLSTTIVYLAAFAIVIFVAGLNYRIIGSLFMIALPILAVMAYLIAFHPEVKILHSHQYNRLLGFYSKNVDDPKVKDLRYQQENALLAIGSGGLKGKGLYNNDETSVKNSNLIPEDHTDFVFTVIGEELGFVGCIAVLALIALIVLECFLTGGRVRDPAGKLYCYGFGSTVAIQSFINIAVNTMLLPNTGLPLPFLSYGLTSLVSMFIGMGIVLNIGLHTKKSVY